MILVSGFNVVGDAIERGSRMRLAKCKLMEGGCRVRAKVAALCLGANADHST